MMAEFRDRSGWIGKTSGIVIWLVGGDAGKYFSIQNNDRPRERSLLVKSKVVCW